MRKFCAGLGLVILIAAGCDDSPTGSNEVLPPESPLSGRVIAVDRSEGSFVVETRDGQQVSFPIGDQAPGALGELRRSAEPVEVVSQLRSGELQVVSVKPRSQPRALPMSKVVALLERRVDVPVVLPDGIPDGAVPDVKKPLYRIGSKREGVSGWNLHLTFGSKEHLYIQYGLGMFDGCGGDRAQPVQIGDEMGLVDRSPGVRWSSVVWPATKEHPQGHYGLSGNFSPRAIVRMARSMETKAEAQSRTQDLLGC